MENFTGSEKNEEEAEEQESICEESAVTAMPPEGRKDRCGHCATGMRSDVPVVVVFARGRFNHYEASRLHGMPFLIYSVSQYMHCTAPFPLRDLAHQCKRPSQVQYRRCTSSSSRTKSEQNTPTTPSVRLFPSHVTL